MIPPGTVDHLDGAANHVDYPELWKTLPPVVGQVYLFGDLNCHQKWYRSFYINGNQMPVCARDTGMFLGMALGAALMATAEVTGDIYANGLAILPGRMRLKMERWPGRKTSAILLFILSLLPMGADGFLQALTTYESNNTVRLITGMLGGFAIAVGLAAMLEALFRYPSAPPPPHRTERG
ncbi:MAG: DUF2085 domain-containing protein [Thermoplasmata archaeon]|nr:DUF2085 domain-containing protein [Thermoplasmata archaeon]